jgi:hypothetical protein
MNTLLMLLLALPGAGEPLVVFDLEAALAPVKSEVLRYDTMKLVASLQGLANRDRPRLFVKYLKGAGPKGDINIDVYWLEKLREDWLKDRPVEEMADLLALLTRFRADTRGVVLWDPAVPATANIAATVCGVDGLLPVRAESTLYRHIVEAGPELPVKLSLVDRFDGSESGSAKCDAYRWALREYLEKGKCHPALMAYYVDAYTQHPDQPGVRYSNLAKTCLMNHDYYIAQRAFFMDLGVWPDETPVDEPDQPEGADRETLVAILKAQYERNEGNAFTSVGGFIPWDQKYTTHGAAGGKHDPVPTEWEYAAILSAHNAIMDADALGLCCMPNASVYRYMPLKKMGQNAPPPPAPLEDKTYVLIYMGDYDSAAWLSWHMPLVWDDPVRGEVPAAWAFNPNLSDRAPHVFNYVYATRSDNDWFIGGDSGAGYLNPNLLTGDRLGSGLPDALELWVRHNRHYYDLLDYSITGFVINGFHGDMPLRIQKAYTRFSPDGVGMQLGFEKPLVNGTPFLRHSSDIYPKGDFTETAAQMAAFAKGPKPRFLIFRWILQRPSTMKAVRAKLRVNYPDEDWEFCDPHTFFDLYERHLKESAG